jgi:hypothetical protein
MGRLEKTLFKVSLWRGVRGFAEGTTYRETNGLTFSNDALILVINQSLTGLNVLPAQVQVTVEWTDSNGAPLPSSPSSGPT